MVFWEGTRKEKSLTSWIWQSTVVQEKKKGVFEEKEQGCAPKKGKNQALKEREK